jgi:tRNA(Arg) A34 adenosine deaminase TadA
LSRAVSLAKNSKEKTKHGCLIVRGGSLQGLGINVSRNTPGIVMEIDALGVHAEIRALKSCTRTDGAVAYIARVNRRGMQRQSRPCPNCIVALKNAGIKRVIYTVDSSIYL